MLSRAVFLLMGILPLALPAHASIQLQLNLLTVDPGPDSDPETTASQTVFVSPRLGTNDIFRSNAANDLFLVAGGASFQSDPDVDGDVVVFVDDLVGNNNIGTLNLGTGVFNLLTVDPGNDSAPAISGTTVYFVSDRFGNPDIFTVDANVGGVSSFAATAAVEGAPSADGPLVAWHAFSNGDFDVLASFDGAPPSWWRAVPKSSTTRTSPGTESSIS